MFSFGQIAGRHGPVPVFGTPSASRLSAHEELTAQYYVYEIETRADSGARLQRVGCSPRPAEASRAVRGAWWFGRTVHSACAPKLDSRDMPKIGLISNPQSQRNRRGLDEIGAAVAGIPDVIHIATDGLEGVDEVLRELARREVGVLLISGGDGTVQTVLTPPVRDDMVRAHALSGDSAARRG